MKYTYHVSCFAEFEIEVEADSPQEAYRKAREAYEDANMGEDGFEFVDEISDNLYDEDLDEVNHKLFK